MNSNSERLELPDSSPFLENWLRFPQEELAKYRGKQAPIWPI